MTLQRGFTLLEMMVVMVLLGLVTTLALPAMQRWHDAVQNKSQAAEIIDALRAASFSAGASRRDIVVDDSSFEQATAPEPAASAASADSERARRDAVSTPDAGRLAGADRSGRVDDTARRLALTLPTGWQAEQVDDIRFLANGLCRPGSILLRTARGDAVNVEVRGPMCGVELGQQDGVASR